MLKIAKFAAVILLACAPLSAMPGQRVGAASAAALVVIEAPPPASGKNSCWDFKRALWTQHPC
jgi:hypothetical protein